MTNSITIDVQGFKKVLDMVKGVVPSKAALPILLDVKIDWDKQQDKFFLSATNGDQYITVVVETPTRLTREQKDILRKFEEVTAENANPKRKSFFEKLRENFK